MPRRKRDEAVAERAQQLLDEKAERRRLSAQVAAGTRRQRRAQKEAEAQDQAKPKRVAESALGGPPSRSLRDSGTTRAKVERKERKPRVHQDLLTVAYRGPLAGKFREMAERHQMSLARLLQDALLTYERSIAAGYQPGATLEEWKAQQAQESREG